jgi:hypothetical protein
MSNQSEERQDDYFGLSPHCQKTDGYINVGRAHYNVCDEHKVRWFVGENLFSSHHYDTDEDKRQAAEIMASYTEVEPFHYPETIAERKASIERLKDLPVDDGPGPF